MVTWPLLYKGGHYKDIGPRDLGGNGKDRNSNWGRGNIMKGMDDLSSRMKIKQVRKKIGCFSRGVACVTRA